MGQTAKDLVEVTLGLIGKDGRTFPTQRDIRDACGGTGSYNRMDQALLTVQVARGLLNGGQVKLDKDFAAVLATMTVPTVAPSFDGVTGIPEGALAKFREGIVLLGMHVESGQTNLLQRRDKERAAWEDQTGSLRQQVDSLVESLDEAERVARETEQRHAAALSSLREQTGVLEKELEFVRMGRSDAERRMVTLETELQQSRAAMSAEIEMRHGAEKRVAALEASIAAHAERDAKGDGAGGEGHRSRKRATTAA